MFKRNLTISSQSTTSSLNSSTIKLTSLNYTLLKSCETKSERQKIICPSLKIFQLPLNDIQIIDILKRQELTLPEINKNKLVWDPLLINQVSRELPQREEASKPSMECGKPLFSELRWRSRKMNIKRRRKYLKKLQFKIQTRLQNKAKRYQDLCNMISAIHEKKTQAFDPMRYINRELEKARFFGYRSSPIYDQYRDVIEKGVKSFDDKFFTKFEDKREPLHLRLEKEFFGNGKKN